MYRTHRIYHTVPYWYANRIHFIIKKSVCIFERKKNHIMGHDHPEVEVYASFVNNEPVTEEDKCLSGLGRCCIFVKEESDVITSIVEKTIQQNVELQKGEKQTAKKYMKQSVAEAQTYLTQTLGVDVSIVNVHLCLESCDAVIESDGCLVSCWLDAGCDKVLLPYKKEEDAQLLKHALEVARVPKERLMVHLPSSSTSDMVSIVNEVSDFICGVSISLTCNDYSTTKEKETFLQNLSVPVTVQLEDCKEVEEEKLLAVVKEWADKKGIVGISLVDPTSHILGYACIEVRYRTDRPDGLYTTVVCTRNNEALGLVYSSKDSVVAALQCGRGVYYSRSRGGLWRKGDTSGHYQTLHRIDVDCDGDALRFLVTQNTSSPEEQAAFCHLKTLTCWGHPPGMKHLEQTLQQRFVDAPMGSYTKRLFEDAELLTNKLVEEAQELSEATTKQHVAEELADVLYFAMVRATAAGVSLDDAAAELDKRSRKVTRRKGDAKAERIAAANAILKQTKS